MLFSYIAYRELLAARVMNVLDKYLEMKTIEIHLDRLSDIVMAPPESSGDVRTLPPSSTQRLVGIVGSFRDLVFIFHFSLRVGITIRQRAKACVTL